MFNERERAFELKFAHDEELRFLTLARRNRLFACWVAERLGLRGKSFENYVRSLVDATALHIGDQHLIEVGRRLGRPFPQRDRDRGRPEVDPAGGGFQFQRSQHSADPVRPGAPPPGGG